ncbi:MAG: hypothetical protein CAK90_05365 [Spartobacteria bacterium AMD-G4]|nr:MAG: hypothetical protein CAK90_05365 [Spartobacteria bacterium AMD-G4]
MSTPKGPDPLASFASDPLAQAAVVLLGKGKWRQARDEAKLLCKKDRNKYLTLLAAANIGLFRDLLSKNLSTDAKTVLENLRTLCPREVVEGLEREMASTQVAQATGGAALPQSGLNLLWHPLKHFAAESSSTANPENLDWLLVDSVVTAFTPAPVEGEDALGCRLAAELAMVHAACRAVSEGRMEEAVNAMRPLPTDSVFRHWKIFLRGVRHFISGAKKEAEECFSRLPESGACATAAATILNKPHSVQIPAVGKAAWTLATVGESPARAREIATADECWKKGNWTGTKDALTRALGKGFSIKQRGIERALSDDLFFFGPEESLVEKKRFDQAAQFFVQQRNSSRYATELSFSISHGMLLGDIDVIPDSNLEAEFFDILVLASDFLGQNPIAKSLTRYFAIGIASNHAVRNARSKRSLKPRNALRTMCSHGSNFWFSTKIWATSPGFTNFSTNSSSASLRTKKSSSKPERLPWSAKPSARESITSKPRINLIPWTPSARHTSSLAWPGMSSTATIGNKAQLRSGSGWNHCWTPPRTARI